MKTEDFKVGMKLRLRTGFAYGLTTQSPKLRTPREVTITSVGRDNTKVSDHDGNEALVMESEYDFVEILPNVNGKPIDVNEIYNFFLSNLDLSNIGRPDAKKIALIKILRTFSMELFPHCEEKCLKFKEAKELVESTFTVEQLYPITYCTDHSKWKAGDIIEVRDFVSDDWRKATYVCYVEGGDFPFITVRDEDEDLFPDHGFATEKYAYARKEIK